MSKGFKAKTDKQTQTSNSAAQLQSLTQMVIQTSRHLQQLQNEVGTIANLLRYSQSNVAISENCYAIIDSVGNFVNADGSKGDKFGGATLITHAVDMSKGKSYIDGFVDALSGKKAGDIFEATLKFPDSYGEAAVAGKEVLFTISIVQVLQAPANQNAILDLLK